MSDEADGARFGDLLGEALKRPRPSAEPVRLSPPSIAELPTTEAKLRRLAAISRVPYSKLEAEVQGPDGFAEIARLLWNIPSQRSGPGRPPEDAENWRFFLGVTALAKTTGSISDAIRTYVSWPGNETLRSKRPKTLRMQYDRLCQKWPDRREISLADLFEDAPPKSSTK